MTGGSTPRDVKVISSDGIAIYVHFFPAQGAALGTKAPTILDGPGLGLPGETNPTLAENPFLANQVIGIASLLKNGYNVVTWDPRGEWSSGGSLDINNQNFEGQDMKAIISWIATQPEVALDSPGDPKIGMVGASYGGGIQLVTAAIDPRVDAIVPTVAWNNLNTSLDKNGAPKTSWGILLTAALLLTGARVNPHIYPALVTTLLTGAVSPFDQDFLDERSPSELVNQISAPTLLIQGTVDTLFTLAEADLTAKALIAHGVPTKVVWFCGGHGGCISSVNDGEVVERSTMDWLNRYVKGDGSVVTGPQFEWVDQHGTKFSSNTYPVPTGTPLTTSSSVGQTLPLRLFFGGSGPNFRAFEAGLFNGVSGFLFGAKATNAVELTSDAQDDDHLHRGSAEAGVHLFGHGIQPPCVRPTGRRHHGAGVGQPRHADPGDVGRGDAHGEDSVGNGGAHAGAEGDGDAATGRLGRGVSSAVVVGRAECVEHQAHVADRQRGGDHADVRSNDNERGVAGSTRYKDHCGRNESPPQGNSCRAADLDESCHTTRVRRPRAAFVTNARSLVMRNSNRRSLSCLAGPASSRATRALHVSAPSVTTTHSSHSGSPGCSSTPRTPPPRSAGTSRPRTTTSGDDAARSW